MPRRIAALLIAPAVLLTACGGDDGAGPTVSGKPGAKPSISVPGGKPSTKFDAKTVTEGKGPAVKKGDYVLVNVTVKVWGGKKDLLSSYDQGGRPEVLNVGAQTGLPAINKGLPGKKVGSRVLLVAPPADAFGPQGNPQLGVKASDTVLFVVDILKARSIDPKAKAEGKQKETGAGLPKVEADQPKAAKITVPAGAPEPKRLRAEVLIQGKGEQVKPGQTLITQYTGATFKDGKKFDSSWDAGNPVSFPIGVGGVIKGWDQGLVGKHVGDRVLLVIPADLAYGATPPQGSGIPKNAPLAFVVDILGAL